MTKLFPIIFLIFFTGCASVKTLEQGTVDAPMEEAVQDAKDALNTHGFDIQNEEVSEDKSTVSGKSATDQEAWVEIDPEATQSSRVEVKVNMAGDDEVGADILFDDIKARSEK